MEYIMVDNVDDVVNKLVEVELKQEQDFLKIKETLTRIGVASKKTKTLFQSCHILHKRGKYYICHFKELFLLDGKDSNINEQDIQRRNAIVDALQSWGLLRVVNPDKIKDPSASLGKVAKVVPFKEKSEWQLVTKYTIGGRK